MLFCLSSSTRCLSFILHQSCCLAIMAISMLSIVLISIAFVTFSHLSIGSLRSWFCGTSTICQTCPSCESHLHIHVSSKCQCRENLNNCNCNCVAHKNLKKYQSQWNSSIMINQHNNHATQMNTHKVNHCLLFSLIALSHHYAAWEVKPRVKRRSHLMKKLNLVEPPIHSPVEIQSPLSLHTVSATITATVSPLPSSSADPSQQLDIHKKLRNTLPYNLEADQQQQPSTTSSPFPRIK